MLWDGRRESGNLIDRRGVKAGGVVGAGGLIIALIYALLGGDPSVVLDQAASPASQPTSLAGNDDQKRFVGVVLADTEDTWKAIFAAQNQRYEEPKLVLFSDRVASACGTASSAVGPFYCPRDHQVYLDLNFFSELEQRFGARGDFARAYVIAHEVGHHVQNLLGAGLGAGGRRDSVRIELQADCLAGVWANQTDRAKKILEAGDVDEALGAAAAVGDDRLQRESQGTVVPDSFTHGSSQQRVEAFTQGFKGGTVDVCGLSGIAH